MKKDLHKLNDVIDNDIIILRPLSFAQKYRIQEEYKKICQKLMMSYYSETSVVCPKIHNSKNIKQLIPLLVVSGRSYHDEILHRGSS